MFASIHPAAAEPGVLRVLACGSVDDGKSTLIGRLLHDAGALADDQFATLARESARGGGPRTIDFSLLLDGLEAEREQGITIDIAWRTLATPGRRLLIADAPGHEQYTRNMATAASMADAAVLLVDARHGLRSQTLRHAAIAAMFGVRDLVLAINKMDLVDFAEERAAAIEASFRDAVRRHRLTSVKMIPLVAPDGDNVVQPSTRMPWYVGPTLLDHLFSGIGGVQASTDGGFRMSVQRVTRLAGEQRFHCGTIASGRIATGAAIAVAGRVGAARVARIAALEGDRTTARVGEAAMILLDRPLDVSRGDVLCDPATPPPLADQFAATLLWVADAPLIPGRPLLVKHGTRQLGGVVARIRHRIEIATGAPVTAEALHANEIGLVQLTLDAPIAFEPYATTRALGAFVLIDRQTQVTLGAGILDEARAEAANVVWHGQAVTREARAEIKGQRAAVVWLTGLSGAGKSTIADQVARRLQAMGRHAYVLDGDNLRHGLNRDLGFSETDRVENIRRAAEVAALMADAGLIVIASFISPYRADRELARQRCNGAAFLEVFVDTPVDECARRDTKGLYARALAGEIREFTGVSSPYEPPEKPDLRLVTAEADSDTLAARVVAALDRAECLQQGPAPPAQLGD